MGLLVDLLPFGRDRAEYHAGIPAKQEIVIAGILFAPLLRTILRCCTTPPYRTVVLVLIHCTTPYYLVVLYSILVVFDTRTWFLLR